MKRLVSLLLCAALIVCVFAGCADEEAPYVPTGDALDSNSDSPNRPATPEQQDLTMVYYPDRSMNPYTSTDYTNRALMPLMYQGLFAVDRDYNVTPILCQQYRRSGDMKTYTFYLAEAWFADGTALTPQDVVASYNAAKQGSYYQGRFQHITSVTAEGTGVVIQLDTPCENLPILLDIPIVKASQVAEKVPLGTGAYLLEDALSGKRLRRQAAWWCNDTQDLLITSSYIPLVEAQSPEQVRNEFERGDVGLVCTDPGSDLYADYRYDYELWDSENGYFLYLVCNANSEVFSNDTVRKALTHAIDRDALAKEDYRGFARSATLPASPLSPCYNATLAERYGYDSLKFTTALTDTAMQGKEVTMIVNSGDSLRIRVARKIADMLTECGLTVKIAEYGGDDFIEHLRWGKYDLYLGQTKLSPNMDLSAFFQRNGSLSYGGLADSTIYNLAQQSLANSGNYYNLHETVMEDAQLCPILTRSYAICATRGLVTDLTPARDNLFFHTVGRTMSDALLTQ